MWEGKQLRANNFDALRFSMALLVIFSHSFPILNGVNISREPMFTFTSGANTMAGLAVDVFFIISGFLITRSWERSKNSFDYLKKRVARIVPAYVCVTLICAFVVQPLFSDVPHWFTWKRANYVGQTMLWLGEYHSPEVFPHNPITQTMDGSAWTISYEFECYLALMVAGWIGMVRKKSWLVVLFVPVLLVHSGLIGWPAMITEFVKWAGNSAFRFSTYFLAGSIFCVYREKIPFQSWIALVAGAVLVLCVVKPVIYNLLMPLALTYVTLWVAFQPYLKAHRFAKYGDFSYGIYLYGFVLQQELVALFPRKFTPFTLGLTAGLLAIISGILSWHLVEKHFLSRTRVEHGARPDTVSPEATPQEKQVAGSAVA